VRNILIFGGSFSPPTLAHEAIARACLALPGFDEVWLLPSGGRADKTISFDDNDRLAMLRLVRVERFAGDSRLVISDFELQLPRPTQTYKTVEALAAAFPDCEFRFVYGADSYAGMPHWPHGRELQKTLPMLVFERGGMSLATAANVLCQPMPTDFASVSSTQVRHVLECGGDLSGLVSPPIARYVQRITKASRPARAA